MEEYVDNHINILLIEDNPGDTRMIRELFAEARGICPILLCADRLSSGIQQIRDGGVDVILLDLSLPDSQGFETFSRLRAQSKGLPVILLTGLEDEELGMRAVREGAQDYILKGSVSSLSLARAVRFAVERQKTLAASVDARPGAEPGRIVGFLGAKGGVGTTTVALNTAAILAAQGKSVIALELRSYSGSFSSQTQESPSRNLKHLLDLEPEQITAAQLKKCLVTLPFAVQAIYAPQKPDEFMEIRPAHVEAILRQAQQIADYVVVDLPPAPGYISQAAGSFDLVMLVVERDAACVAAGRLAVQLLRQWGAEESSIAAAIVIKDALAAFMSPADVGAGLGCAIAGMVLPAGDACRAAARAGTPLALMEPDSIAATNLTALAAKLTGRTLVSMSA
jgi:Flp pilus assembly CpaE family ATPase